MAEEFEHSCGIPRSTFALESFRNVQELIRFIDTKAGAILVVYGLILTIFMEIAKRTNGYKAWAGAIFVDLRDSTTLFTANNDVDISKVVRGFTSEIIEMLRKDIDGSDLKEIGIRGDCVFAVYSTPLKSVTPRAVTTLRWI